MSNITRIICSNCGAELQGIPAHQYTTLANIIGLDSGLGTIQLPMSCTGHANGTSNDRPIEPSTNRATATSAPAAPMTAAMRRLEAMRQAGISTEGIIPMRSANGELDQLARLTADGLQMVDDDPVVTAILNGGTVRNAHLFKQWVLTLFLAKASNTNYDWRTKAYTCNRDIDGNMELSAKDLFRYGFWTEHTWGLLNDMLIRQRAMWAHNDMRCFAEDNLWYNKELAVTMFDHYFGIFKTLVRNLKVKHCKGVPYVRVPNAHKLIGGQSGEYKGTFMSDVDRTIIEPMKKLGEAIRNANDPLQLRCAVNEFLKHYIPLGSCNWNFRGTGLATYSKRRNYQHKLQEVVSINYKKLVCPAFYNAYMGYGAFFTMQNLIRFHGCLVHDKGQVLDRDASLAWLDEHAKLSRDNAWWLMGACRALVKDNNFDLCKKKAEWAEAAQQRRANRR